MNDRQILNFIEKLKHHNKKTDGQRAVGDGEFAVLVQYGRVLFLQSLHFVVGFTHLLHQAVALDSKVVTALLHHLVAGQLTLQCLQLAQLLLVALFTQTC